PVTINVGNGGFGFIRSISGSNSLGNVLLNLGAASVAVDAGTLTFASFDGVNAGNIGPGLQKTGPGQLNSSRYLAQAMSISEGTIAVVAGRDTANKTSRTGPYTLAAGATIDLGNNDLIIDYITVNTPLAAVQSQLLSAYNNGSWTGTGMTSSAAA